jgi:hypothetical protein
MLDIVGKGGVDIQNFKSSTNVNVSNWSLVIPTLMDSSSGRLSRIQRACSEP